MPWVAAAAGLAGSVINSSASNSAADAQQSAADQAAALQKQAYADQAPYRQAGVGALDQLTGLSTYDPTPSAQDVMNEPGYQFGLTTGLDNVQSSASAKGGLYSGAALKALTQYGTDYATSKYNDAFNRRQSAFGNRWNRLAGLAGIGQTATQQSANSLTNQGGIYTNNANAQGANSIAQGNIWGNALNQGASAANAWYQAPSTTASPYNPGVGSVSSGGSPDGYWADGGPVRKDPVVGTMGPKRGSTGGGMSRETVIAILDAMPATQQKSGMGALPANPVTNPRAILVDRERAAGSYNKGGPVRGKGGPRSDSIRAMLSNGEHVMRASAVTALGGGSNSAGQKKLSAMQALLDGGTNHAA